MLWPLTVHPNSEKADGIWQRENPNSIIHSVPSYVSRLWCCPPSPARRASSVSITAQVARHRVKQSSIMTKHFVETSKIYITIWKKKCYNNQKYTIFKTNVCFTRQILAKEWISPIKFNFVFLVQNLKDYVEILLTK